MNIRGALSDCEETVNRDDELSPTALINQLGE